MVSITLSQISNTTPENDSDRSVTVLVDKQFDLLRSYALTSLLVMSIIGGLSGALFSSYLADSLLRRDANVSQAFLQSLTEVEGGPNLFQMGESTGIVPQQEPNYDLPELVEHIATMPGVIRANLFSDNGQLLWSTKAELLSKRFPANHELEEALEGEIVFELKDIKEEQKAEYVEFGSDISRLIENYLPIWDIKNHKVVAVVEIYKAPKTLFDAMESAQTLVWISVLGATLFIYISLFGIVYRANNVIRTQQMRLVKSETMVAVGEMASAVAHSIRNPLAAIRSSAELTAETSNDLIVRETADDIISETDRVEQWIRELLIFSRPEGTTQFNTAYLDQILKQCLEGCEGMIKRNGVQVIFRASQNIPAIKGDAGLLGQMFNSVLTNSLESMPSGGILTAEVCTEKQSKMIQISISDTGHGIPKERLETMFETCLTTKRYGLGIGMLLVKRIIERHGGNILLSSKVGYGTTVCIKIPVA